MTTDERLEKLERELSKSKKRFQWLVTGAALCLLAAAGVLSYGLIAPKVPVPAGAVEELRARDFILEDASGRARASLGMDEDGLVFRLRYENGSVGAALCLHEEKAVLSLSGDDGKPRAVLGLAKKSPLLCLYDDREEPRATLAVLADGPHLVLRDEKGNLLPIR